MTRDWHIAVAEGAAHEAWRGLLETFPDVQDAAEVVWTDSETVASLLVEAVEAKLPADEPPGYVVVEFSETFERELERLADSRLEAFLAEDTMVGPR